MSVSKTKPQTSPDSTHMPMLSPPLIEIFRPFSTGGNLFPTVSRGFIDSESQVPQTYPFRYDMTASRISMAPACGQSVGGVELGCDSNAASCSTPSLE